MASTEPLITVIVPIYNADKYLHGCLKSIQLQTFQNWEAILINDGSTDSSIEILDTLAAEEPRFKVIHQKNAGVSTARNKGLDSATAPYITMLDADDYLEPEALETMHAAMQKYNCDLICCTLRRIFLNGTSETDPLPFSEGLHMATPSKIYQFAMRSPNCKLYRTEIIRKSQLRFPTDVAICEDDVFVVSYWSHIKTFAMIGTALYNYIQSESSVLKKLGEGKMPYEVYERTIDVPCLIYEHLLKHISNQTELKNWCKILLRSTYHLTNWMLDCSAKLPYGIQLINHAKRNKKILSQHVPYLSILYIHIRVHAARVIKSFLKKCRNKSII